MTEQVPCPTCGGPCWRSRTPSGRWEYFCKADQPCYICINCLEQRRADDAAYPDCVLCGDDSQREACMPICARCTAAGFVCFQCNPNRRAPLPPVLH